MRSGRGGIGYGSYGNKVEGVANGGRGRVGISLGFQHLVTSGCCTVPPRIASLSVQFDTHCQRTSPYTC